MDATINRIYEVLVNRGNFHQMWQCHSIYICEKSLKNSVLILRKSSHSIKTSDTSLMRIVVKY